jgi:hypothetical protein
MKLRLVPIPFRLDIRNLLPLLDTLLLLDAAGREYNPTSNAPR